MRYEEVLALLREYKFQLVPNGTAMVRGYTFEEYKKLAGQTGQVDYGCDFHNGICQGLIYGAPGCCHNCRPSFGYWLEEPGALDEATVRTMAEYFDATTGFLEAGTGCILPREFRSPTCLYIYCSDDRMSGADQELLLKIKHGANWSRS